MISQQEVLDVGASVQFRKFVGLPLRRKEDVRFLTGKARYITDINLPGMLQAVLVRSAYPHAKITQTVTDKAESLPGVFAVFTGKDLLHSLGEVPCAIKLPFIKYPKYHPIAHHEANYSGEIVAVVLAKDEYVARDATELIEVEYEPLPSVVDAERAIRNPPDALVHEEFPDNLAYNINEKFGNVDSAFNGSSHTFKFRLHNQRIFSAPLETRAVLASYDQSSDELTVWTSTQYPHLVRTFVAKAIKHPENKMRVIAPDLGGGFGGKSNIYAEEILLPYLAKVTGHPIRWLETRTESILATAHGRDVTTYVDIAVEENGRIRGMRVKILANIGAYFHFLTPAFPLIIAFGIPGNYKIPAYEIDVSAIFTNKKSTDAYRGVANSEATFCMERVIDLVADRLGLDPSEVRLENYVRLEDYPYKTVFGVPNPKGDHPQSLRKVLEAIEYERLRLEQEKLRQQGRYIGIGFSSYWELSGFGPPYLIEQVGLEHGAFESASVRILPSGKAVVVTGSSSHGQGHETSFAQMAADSLQMEPDDITVLHGDTLNAPYGIGTFASRSAAVGGAALVTACDRILQKAKLIASSLLAAKASEVEYGNGEFYARSSPSRKVTFGKVVEEAYLARHLPIGVEPGLEAFCYYNPPEPTFASGTHVAVVEVDSDSGKVKVLKYASANDFGTIINPLIVEGQVQGGIMQGIGQALLEEIVYGEEDHQLLGTNFLDYLIPTSLDPMASDFAGFEMSTYKTETMANPLGVKGMGESGSIAAPAAIVNAVSDALRPFKIDFLDMPLKPEKVWRLLNEKSIS